MNRFGRLAANLALIAVGVTAFTACVLVYDFMHRDWNRYFGDLQSQRVERQNVNLARTCTDFAPGSTDGTRATGGQADATCQQHDQAAPSTATHDGQVKSAHSAAWWVIMTVMVGLAVSAWRWLWRIFRGVVLLFFVMHSWRHSGDRPSVAAKSRATSRSAGGSMADA